MCDNRCEYWQNKLVILSHFSIFMLVLGILLLIPAIVQSIIVRFQMIFGASNEFLSQSLNTVYKIRDFVGTSYMFFLCISLLISLIWLFIDITQLKQKQMQAMITIFITSFALYLGTHSAGVSVEVIMYVAEVIAILSFFTCIVFALFQKRKKGAF